MRITVALTAAVALTMGCAGLYAQDATISEAPELHGVVFQAGDGPPVVVQVAATSLEIEEAAIPEVPEGLQVGEGVEEGRYMRQQWDKGAFLRDRFAGRWTGTVEVDAEAEYTFYVTTDDGARLAIDGETLVDVWVPRPPTTSEENVTLTAGDHEVVMTYFEGGGGATARLEWSAEGLERQVIPADKVAHGDQPGWQVEWFSNVELEGDPIGVERSETIDYAWDESGPKIGDEEPGTVGFDWMPIGPGAIVGRIHAGPETKLGIIAGIVGGRPAGVGGGASAGAGISLVLEGGPTFHVEEVERWDGFSFTGGDAEGSIWAPPTEGSLLFVAGYEPLPLEADLNAANLRAKLKEAYLASVKPDLPTGEPDADGYIALFNGEDLEGWDFRRPDANHWEVTEEGMDNVGHGGSDILTTWTHLDCDLHVEFRVPKGSNSGVYLQGRYEIQVLDSYEGPTFPGMCGSIYNVHLPSENVSKPPGEWQTFDIDFAAATLDDDGRALPARVTVTYNDTVIHDDVEVPRATGGEMNRKTLEPGPILLQGNHGPVTYRNLKIRPK